MVPVTVWPPVLVRVMAYWMGLATATRAKNESNRESCRAKRRKVIRPLFRRTSLHLRCQPQERQTLDLHFANERNSVRRPAQCWRGRGPGDLRGQRGGRGQQL